VSKYLSRSSAILLLEDGTVFHGKAVGKIGTTSGEICFNTGMTGYQEIFTDPSYFGQILVTATSHIGNYGVHPKEIESDSLKISGLVCKNFSTLYSRASAGSSIQSYFEEHNIIGISDVDTRAIVKYIRNKGAMNAVISSKLNDIKSLKKVLSKVPSMTGLELSSKVSTKNSYIVGDDSANYRVALLDLGVKKNIIRCLLERDCQVQVFPMNTTFEEIKKWKPDGIMLSNGPGDPSELTQPIKTARDIIASSLPAFGICLGHQVIALAADLKTYKMHNGHRGVNHPVKNLKTGKCEITSQNHGFVVDMEEAKSRTNIEITHVHLNDNTLAGLKIKGKKIFSVQFHPEASAGPNDSRYLFDDFIKLLGNKTKSPELKKAKLSNS